MRFRVAIIAIFLSLFHLSTSQATPPKSGASCSKFGASQISGGKKYSCIKNGKYLVWDKGYSVSGISPQASTPAINLVNTSPEDLSVCRIQQPNRNPNIPFFAYPVDNTSIYAMLPRTGPINVKVIPIDFVDVLGDFVPQNYLEPDIKLIDAWMKWFSHGKSYYSWEIRNNWIRAPKPSTDYVPSDTPWKKGNSTRIINQFEAASELLDVASKYVDFKQQNVVLFVFPHAAKNLYVPWTRNGNFQQAGSVLDGTQKDLGIRDQRLVNVQIEAVTSLFFDQKVPLWSWFLHENLHNQGLLGHAPNNGSPLGIMTNQWGVRLPLQSWDSLILDWQLPTDIYCVKREDLAKVTLVMSPLEREEIGTKAIMIRLSNTQVLVIESRRFDKWVRDINSKVNTSPDLDGLVIYKVDISKVNPYGVQEPDGPEWKDESSSFAYYIRNSAKSRGFRSYPDSYRFDLNFILKQGDVLNYEGIKISLTKSDLHDTVTIEKG